MNRCQPYRFMHPHTGISGRAAPSLPIPADLRPALGLQPNPPPMYIVHCTLLVYSFSAKEKDVETGLSYFGSRYYSSDLSIWLSVDPMSDKYASLSPYVYCADNPIKLKDPDGRKIVFAEGTSEEFKKQFAAAILVYDKNLNF